MALSFTRDLISGARSAVTQPYPPAFFNAAIRAEVIIPRSPTKITLVSEKRSFMASTIAMKLFGSAVLPGRDVTSD